LRATNSFIFLFLCLKIPQVLVRGVSLTEKFKLNKKMTLIMELKKELKGFDKLNVWDRGWRSKDWLNLTLGSDVAENEFKVVDGKPIFKFDIIDDFPPIEDEKLQYMYASHVITHMTFEEAINFLKNCYRVMKKGGVIRVPIPDLELWAKAYLENNRKFLDRYYELALKGKDLRTRGEIFMSHVHGWNHKFAWDFETVKDILERAGFTNVAVKKHRETKLPNIEDIESDKEVRLLETKYIEAEKL